MTGPAEGPAADEVLVERRGRLGILTLNRPKALNALSIGMVERIGQALEAWAADRSVGAVLIEGAGEKAFCAGGDVRAITRLGGGADGERLRHWYYSAEYRLNYLIHVYPKPYIAVLDGITMGGGCGVSLHGSHRVTTERTLIAMPETALGLFPDVGASWFLNQLPGEMGVYLGLTGTRLTAADAVALGMGTHHLSAAEIPALVEDLAAEPALDRASVDAVLGRHAAEPGRSALAARRARVDELFSGETVRAIVSALEAAPEDWAAEALAAIRRASPTSLEVTLRHLRGGRSIDIREIFKIECRLAVRLAGSSDFAEGVRAILIDRDNAPGWRPATLAEIDPAAIERLFAPFERQDWELELGRR